MHFSEFSLEKSVQKLKVVFAAKKISGLASVRQMVQKSPAPVVTPGG